MTQAIHDFALVGAAIRPLVRAFARNFVFLKLPFVNSIVRPLKSPFAMQQTISQLAFILVSILKNASPLSMKHFANLQQ